MNRVTIFLLIIISISCGAQKGFHFDYNNFEKQFLSYEPVQKSECSKKDFEYGCMIIKETKNAINDNPNNFDIPDYFNALSAFLTLKESEENIMIVFEKFKDAEGSCEYFLSLENSVKKYAKYDIIRENYNKQLKKCKSEFIAEKEFNITEYCKKNNLNLTLVEEINRVDISDQKYRGNTSMELKIKQKKFDNQNQAIIDSLYNIHKSYMGRSLVGEKYKSVMWAVIQHSNAGMMERYLPIVQKAVKEKEIDVVPFKMLIDRFYGLKYGYQVYGTQTGFGFELADDKTRKEIEKKYGLE